MGGWGAGGGIGVPGRPYKTGGRRNDASMITNLRLPIVSHTAKTGEYITAANMCIYTHIGGCKTCEIESFRADFLLWPYAAETQTGR